MTRELQVVVWGATGFTGRLVAENLCERYGAGGEVRWGIAGRSAQKLEVLRRDLAEIDPAASRLALIVADSDDAGSLEAMAARADVVCSTVGPYALYGSKLVAACVKVGADYVDLTGEVPWIKQMIDAHHDEAARRGRRIVHCCGFDSIPSDIGVFLLQEAAQQRLGAPLDEVALHVLSTRGGVSGGTVASLMEVLAQVKNPEVRRVLLDPYALNPADGVRGPDGLDQQGVRWDAEARTWTAPFVMAAINARIVRRSNALMGYPYGRSMRYGEVMAMKGGPVGLGKALGVSLGLGSLVGLGLFGPTRRLLEATVLPSPGQGPSKEERERGRFDLRVSGRRGADRMSLRVRGDRDPGYGATAKMLTEAALCLTLDREALPERFGILTPASAMGSALARRLPAVGVTFELEG